MLNIQTEILYLIQRFGMVIFTINITASSGDSGRVPIDVAGSVMFNAQSIISMIGEHSVRHALSLQGIVPEDLLSRFILYIDSSSSSISSTADMRFDGPGSMLKDALFGLIFLFECLNSGSFSELKEKYPDPFRRRNILNGLLSLLKGLRGFELNYSDGERSGSLSSSGSMLTEMLAGEIMCFTGEIVGVLKRTEDGTFLRVSNRDVPIPSGRDDLFGMPCKVSGRVFLSEDGKAERIAEVYTIDKLSEMSFGRMISADIDLVLSSSIRAEVSYDSEHELWTLSSKPLGISISKEDLDEAIIEFHDQFVFMWEIYYEGAAEGESDEEYEEEELEVRNFIISLVKEVGSR